MIRKTIIILLSLLTVVTGVVCLVSVLSPWEFQFGKIGVLFEDFVLTVSRPKRLTDGFWIGLILYKREFSSTWHFPLLTLFILLGFYPTRVFILGPLRRRYVLRCLKADSCNFCKLDLTGNVSDVCPECGKPIPTEQSMNPADLILSKLKYALCGLGIEITLFSIAMVMEFVFIWPKKHFDFLNIFFPHVELVNMLPYSPNVISMYLYTAFVLLYYPAYALILRWGTNIYKGKKVFVGLLSFHFILFGMTLVIDVSRQSQWMGRNTWYEQLLNCMAFVPFILAIKFAHNVVWKLSEIQKAVEHCRKCKYNLTGNVSGVCPECGTPISKTH